MSSTSTEAVLAEFIHDIQIDSVDKRIQHETTRTLINFFAVALSGSKHPTANSLASLIQQEGGNALATVIGMGLQANLQQSSFSNGYLAHLQDFDDTHFPTVLHPSAPIWPATLAIAETKKMSGTDTLLAGMIGLEVACRVANSVHPWHYDQGWHITGTAGVFGAAAAASRLLELSPEQTIQALGLAGTQSAGVRETFGTAGKPLHAGHAASSGVHSALLIQNGFDGPTQILSGRRGWPAVYSSDGFDPSRITEGLGTRWELLNNGLKPYANGVVSHPIQDAIITLRNEHKLTHESIEEINLQVHPLVFELMDRPSPTTGLDAKFSFQHCAATALIYGSGTDEQFSDLRVNEPEVQALRAKIQATINNSFQEDETDASIRTLDGMTYQVHIEHASGSPKNPLSDEKLTKKFNDLTHPVIGTQEAQQLLSGLEDITNTTDILELMRIARGGQTNR